MGDRQCPFCKGRKLTYTFGKKTPIAAVKCEKCGAIGPTVQALPYESLEELKAKATAAWNDRGEDQQKKSQGSEEGRGVGICKRCGREFEMNKRGRKKEFCTDKCRTAFNDQSKGKKRRVVR